MFDVSTDIFLFFLKAFFGYILAGILIGPSSHNLIKVKNALFAITPTLIQVCLRN
jgi:hypothetical protein